MLSTNIIFNIFFLRHFWAISISFDFVMAYYKYLYYILHLNYEFLIRYAPFIIIATIIIIMEVINKDLNLWVFSNEIY